jgi:small subunit ribosomal protein S20
MIDNRARRANNTRLFGYWACSAALINNYSIGNQTVANIKSARKRAKQAEKTRLHKMGLRSGMRTKIRDVIDAVEKGDREAASVAYKAAVPVIDSMINKGVVNKNKAARHKSRLNKMIKAMAA